MGQAPRIAGRPETQAAWSGLACVSGRPAVRAARCAAVCARGVISPWVLRASVV